MPKQAPKQFMLLHKDGSEAKVGDSVTSFRGEKTTIKEIIPPRHSGSSGHVTTDLGLHYPSVYGLEFVQI